MNRFLLLLLALAALVSAGRAEIEFAGILAMPGKTLFALTDTTTARSDWVALKGAFAGFIITSYDQPTDTLTLTRDGASLRVRLKDDAKVKSARFELTGAISFWAGEKVEIERVTLLFDQENVFPLKDGIIYRITPTRLPDGTHRYNISIEKKSVVNGIDRVSRVSAPSVIVLPHQTFRLGVGEIGFSFTPKSP